MERGLNKLIAGVIILWIAVFIFQKEILDFINGWDSSWIKDVLLQIINFMIHWAGRTWDLIKSIFNWVLELISKIISTAIPLIYGLIQGITDVIIKIIKTILGIFQPLLGKFFIR